MKLKYYEKALAGGNGCYSALSLNRIFLRHDLHNINPNCLPKVKMAAKSKDGLSATRGDMKQRSLRKTTTREVEEQALRRPSNSSIMRPVLQVR